MWTTVLLITNHSIVQFTPLFNTIIFLSVTFFNRATFWNISKMLIYIRSEYSLCCTMVCFHVISISMISRGDYLCAHYFLWRMPQCTLLLCSINHYNITMVNGINRNDYCDITIGNNIARDIYCDIIMSNDDAMKIFYYVLLHIIMILLFHQ